MLANSLFIRFSSSSLALAFLKSAIKDTNPRIAGTLPELFRLKRPPPPVPDAILETTDVATLVGGRFPPGRYPDKTTGGVLELSSVVVSGVRGGGSVVDLVEAGKTGQSGTGGSENGGKDQLFGLRLRREEVGGGMEMMRGTVNRCAQHVQQSGGGARLEYGCSLALNGGWRTAAISSALAASFRVLGPSAFLTPFVYQPQHTK